MNQYDVLGLNEYCSIDDIKSKYRQLAKVYHPDANHGSSDKFIQLKKAYDYLLIHHTEKKKTDPIKVYRSPPQEKKVYTNVKKYYEIFKEKVRSGKMIFEFDEFDSDSILYLLIDSREYRLNILKGTKVPNKLVVDLRDGSKFSLYLEKEIY